MAAHKQHKSPINRSILIGCGGLIVVLSLLLSLHTRSAFSNALYEQYNARLRDVITAVEHCADADDLRECIQKGESSPKRDELQKTINRFVDDFELVYLYIVIPKDTPDGTIISVVSSTSAEEVAAGDGEDWPILYDCSDEYTREQVQPYLDAWDAEDTVFFEDVSDYGDCYTGCRPLRDSSGETIALIGADYLIDDVRDTVSGYVLRSVMMIVGVCALFGALLALWLRRNVTRPIRALEQSALRFARMTHDVKDAADLSLDTDMEASSEVKLLIDAMVQLSREMKDQVENAAEVENYAKEMEEENQRLTEKAEAAIKIAELTQSVTALLTNMPGMTSSKDVETGKYLACNQTFAEFANRRSPEAVIGLTDRDIFDEATAAKFAEDDKKALSMDSPHSFYEEVLDAAGNQREFQTTRLKFTDTTGRLCTLCMRLDYTELMRVKRETAEAKEAYEKAQNASNMYSHIAQALSANYAYLYYVDLETEEYVEYLNASEDRAATENHGGGFFAVVCARQSEQIVHPEDREYFRQEFTKENVLRVLAESDAFTLTYRHLIDGETSYVTLRATRMQDDAGHIFVGINNNQDVEARSELTGLYMEPALHVRGKELLHEHPEGWCMIAIDLEHFKLFNEWYGREAGDELLRQIGERLARVETETEGLACYMGQDDFALLAPYDEESVNRLFDGIHEMIMEHGTSVGFMPAFGVCMTDGKNGVEELLDRAAQASQHAKEDYHHRIRIFEEAMYQKTERDYQILSDFQQALQDHELFINLQPQCEVESGKVIGAESLVRWKKADGSMVSPGIFVPVLEQYGFVTDLDQFVWEEVCAWQKSWIDGGHTPLPISVNVSQIDIFTIDVPAYFDLLLWKYKLPVDVIKIEITESAYVGDGAVADTVRRLREKGFLVLMDDFGSGYSSLNMLRTLNVDIIKLDAKFLRMNSDDLKGVHILESIVGMAKSMEAPIIVEGVETEEETEFIKKLGCRYVQGYRFYRPMLVPDFEALIGDENNIDTSGFSL
ncbi:MAG: EAL domain-containing protein [Ruminococcaceae bacterium]|nr:EAL domain-containing protein [Oscillospiraceae bacterium]